MPETSQDSVSSNQTIESWVCVAMAVHQRFCCSVYAAQVGFKLLAFDVRVASGLAFKAMRGNQLTR
jgi:hypothetical protein